MDKFIVRLPEGMRDRIKAAAENAGRSMNAEIVAALADAYPEPAGPEDVVRDVAWLLSGVEPTLRAQAINLLAEQANDGKLSLIAEASAYAERDQRYRFPWEDD
ncbi:Arc family DNA-binding protein [Vannielia sp. SX4]|uniref:Arc family DNA-binding protein n=1 Tax=Vannielia sp. SX4 TaxID=3463852 RepID=UPI004059B867